MAGAIATEPRIAIVLDSPRVGKAVKGQLLEDALGDVAPAPFVRFLQAVVRRGRQGLIGEIAREYAGLVDVQLNRVHAGITLSTEPDARLRRQIMDRLSKVLGKDVRAHFRTDEGLLGGVVVRVGDRVFDGSLKRRLTTLRRMLLAGS